MSNVAFPDHREIFDLQALVPRAGWVLAVPGLGLANWWLLHRYAPLEQGRCFHNLAKHVVSKQSNTLCAAKIPVI